MKNRSKYRRRSFIIQFLSVITLVLLLALLMQVLFIRILPLELAVPLLGSVLLFTLVVILIYNFTAKRPISRFISGFLIVAMTATYGLGNYYIYKTTELLSEVTNLTNEVTHSVSVVTMKQNPFEELENLNGATIGITPSLDSEGTKKAMDDIDQTISYETVEYDTYADELADLYAGDIDAIILNDSHRSMIYELEIYGHFSTQTKVLHETKWRTKRTTSVHSANAVNVTTEPFTVLISGNDSYGGLDENSRSDSNILVTVNPTTNVVLMTSIPRDSYMEMVCTADSEDCPDGQEDKLTHSGLYGVGTTEQSLEKYFDIDINYFTRVNFSSLVNLVDALGGIDVEVGEGLAVESFRANDELEGVHEGMNHLDGERALAYSRERYAYEDGDVQRVKNQQQVLRAIIQKIVSPTMVTRYGAFVDALSGSFETNMSSNDLVSLVRYQFMFSPEWNFKSYGLVGYDDTLMCPTIGDAASVIVLDEDAVDTAQKKIQAVLNGEDPDDVEDTAPDITFGGQKEEEATEDDEETEAAEDTVDVYSQQEPVYYDPNQYQQNYYDPSYAGY